MEIEEKSVFPHVMSTSALALALFLPTAYGQPGPGAAAAAAPANPDSGQVSDEPLAGVVLNRTITVMGWDFYQYFTATWRALHANERISLSVHERPTARWGSEIWIQYGQKRVFQTFLSPARSMSREVSKKAVEMAYRNAVEINVQRALFTSVDLGPEEL